MSILFYSIGPEVAASTNNLSLPGLDTSNVDGGAVLLEEALALDFVEFGRLVEKLSLEIFFVDFAVADAENHEHLKRTFKTFLLG